MRLPVRVLVLTAVTAVLLGIPATASARHLEVENAFEHTKNLHLLGFPPRPNTISPFTANSDLAFWGKLAFQGHYDGFRIINIAAPANPREIVFQECFGNQGDLVVWDDILIRPGNSPPPAGVTCDGQPVPEGFEGVHVFDISDLTDPVLVGAVETECGSHTATLAPDLANNRLIVYSNVSSGCDWIDVIEVPLANPAGARLLRTEPLEGPVTPEVAPGCHDMGVIQGTVNLAACASADATNVFDIGPNQFPGGSLEDPVFLYTIREPGVGDLTQGSGRWHSAAFTWDGKVIILGWEPGGGAAPRCTETGTILPDGVVQTDTYKSAFFYDEATGAKEFAHADPAPLVPTQLGGDWSTYWYNGRIYESDITRGLLVWQLRDKRGGRAPQ